MAQVVQAKCPHCKQVLRIPGEWLGRPMRCKHCHQVFQAKMPAPVPTAKPANPLPTAKPEAIKPSQAASLPLAKPIALSNPNPFAFDARETSRPGPANGTVRRIAPRPPRSRASTWWVGALIAAFLVGIGGFVWLVWGEDLLGFVAGPPDKEEARQQAVVQGAPEKIVIKPNPVNLDKSRSNPDKSPPPPTKDGVKDRVVVNKDGARDKMAGKDTAPPKKDGGQVKPPADGKEPRDKAVMNKDGARDKGPAKDKVVKKDGPKDKAAPKMGDSPPKDGKNKDKAVADKQVVKVDPNKDKPVIKDAPKPKDKPPADKLPKDGKKPPKEGVKDPAVKDAAKPKDKPPADKKPKDTGKKPRTGPAEFPRRALFISVNNYLFANPLSYGAKDSSTGKLLQDFQRYLHFPQSQLLELSDGSAQAHAPTKPVIEQTITDFLKVSRPMDRVVVFFTGHAVEIEKEAYLVPIDANLSDPKGLIKLSWVYDALAKCPARQKVLVLDVCRLDPKIGQERQGAGPMGAALDAALRKPPAGVQVWSSCVAGQQSYDLDGGSLFIEALCANLEQKAVKGIPLPTDPLPLEVLRAKVQEYMEPALKEKKLAQTCRLTGREPARGAEYDPDAPLPPAVAIKAGPSIRDIVTDPAQIQLVLDEIGNIPPPRGGVPLKLRAGGLGAFPAKAMKKYQVDYKSVQDLDAMLEAQPKAHPLIRAVRNATRVLEENSRVNREALPGKGLPIPAQTKNQVMKEQEQTAKSMLSLMEALEDLKKANEQLDEESPHWQANYHYVLAKLISRIVYLREWSLMMGKIRKDELPMLAEGDTGWKLAGVAKLSSKDPDIKDLMKLRKKSLDRIKKKYAGTPWEVLARREEATYLGLEWKANSGR